MTFLTHISTFRGLMRMHRLIKLVITPVLLGMAGLSCCAYSQENIESESMNPLSTVISLPLENNTLFNDGEQVQPDQVKQKLEKLADDFATDGLMPISITYEFRDSIACYKLVADAMGLVKISV